MSNLVELLSECEKSSAFEIFGQVNQDKQANDVQENLNDEEEFEVLDTNESIYKAKQNLLNAQQVQQSLQSEIALLLVDKQKLEKDLQSYDGKIQEQEQKKYQTQNQIIDYEKTIQDLESEQKQLSIIKQTREQQILDQNKEITNFVQFEKEQQNQNYLNHLKDQNNQIYEKIVNLNSTNLFYKELLQNEQLAKQKEITLLLLEKQNLEIDLQSFDGKIQESEQKKQKLLNQFSDYKKIIQELQSEQKQLSIKKQDQDKQIAILIQEINNLVQQEEVKNKYVPNNPNDQNNEIYVKINDLSNNKLYQDLLNYENQKSEKGDQYQELEKQKKQQETILRNKKK